MFQNKRGQSLPMNVVIIGIIVLVVLLLVLLFFVGGFSKIRDGLSNAFGGATAGTDAQQAVQFCQGYCNQAQQLGTPPLVKNSAFCKKTFSIDQNGDGKADRVGGKDDDTTQPLKKFSCGPVSGTGSTDELVSLDVNCPSVSCA